MKPDNTFKVECSLKIVSVDSPSSSEADDSEESSQEETTVSSYSLSCSKSNGYSVENNPRSCNLTESSFVSEFETDNFSSLPSLSSFGSSSSTDMGLDKKRRSTLRELLEHPSFVNLALVDIKDSSQEACSISEETASLKAEQQPFMASSQGTCEEIVKVGENPPTASCSSASFSSGTSSGTSQRTELDYNHLTLSNSFENIQFDEVESKPWETGETEKVNPNLCNTENTSLPHQSSEKSNSNKCCHFRAFASSDIGSFNSPKLDVSLDMPMLETSAEEIARRKVKEMLIHPSNSSMTWIDGESVCDIEKVRQSFDSTKSSLPDLGISLDVPDLYNSSPEDVARRKVKAILSHPSSSSLIWIDDSEREDELSFCSDESRRSADSNDQHDSFLSPANDANLAEAGCVPFSLVNFQFSLDSNTNSEEIENRVERQVLSLFSHKNASSNFLAVESFLEQGQKHYLNRRANSQPNFSNDGNFSKLDTASSLEQSEHRSPLSKGRRSLGPKITISFEGSPSSSFDNQEGPGTSISLAVPGSPLSNNRLCSSEARHLFSKISRASLGSLIWIDKTPTQSMEIPAPFCAPTLCDYDDMKKMVPKHFELEIKPLENENHTQVHSSQILIRVEVAGDRLNDRIRKDSGDLMNHGGLLPKHTMSSRLLQVPSFSLVEQKTERERVSAEFETLVEKYPDYNPDDSSTLL